MLRLFGTFQIMEQKKNKKYLLLEKISENIEGMVKDHQIIPKESINLRALHKALTFSSRYGYTNNPNDNCVSFYDKLTIEFLTDIGAWKSPEIEPTKGVQDIVVDCGNNKIEFIRYRTGTPVEWTTFVSKNNITRWAYSIYLVLNKE